MIIRRMDGKVRLVSDKNIAFEERVIEGEKCYFPIGHSDIKLENEGGKTLYPDFSKYDVVEMAGKFYACDTDAEGTILKICDIEDKSYLKRHDTNEHFQLETINNYKFACVVCSITGKTTRIYAEGNNYDDRNKMYCIDRDWEKDCYLSVTTLLKTNYVLGIKEKKAKSLYSLKFNGWLDVGDIGEDEYIKLREFQGEPYAYICEDGAEHAVCNLLETNKRDRGCPNIELQVFCGKVYGFGKNMRGKVKKIKDLETGNEVTSQWDRLELKELCKNSDKKSGKIYAYDLDEDGKLKGVYSFNNQRRATSKNDHLTVLDRGDNQSFYDCDSEGKKIMVGRLSDMKLHYIIDN